MDINATFAVELVIFSIFYVFVKRSLWPLFSGVLEERQSVIRDGLASAEEGRLLLATARKEADKMMNDARAKSYHILQQAEAELEILKNEHKREIESLRLESQKQILAEQDRVRAEFLKQAQMHYLSLVEGVLSKVLADDSTVVHQSLEQVLVDSFNDRH